jgi:hypothetical protein
LSTDLARQRCFNHADREAAARCPACRRHYCRECVIEHESRLLCAACVAAEAARDERRVKRHGWPAAAAGALLGLMLAWCFFFILGWGLLSLPSPTHAADVWGGWGVND